MILGTPTTIRCITCKQKLTEFLDFDEAGGIITVLACGCPEGDDDGQD